MRLRKRPLSAEIERVYAARYASFCRLASTVTGNAEAAHDAVQEGFARALARRDEFRGEGSLEGWLWRIVLRVALEGRKNGRPHALYESSESDAAACRSVSCCSGGTSDARSRSDLFRYN